MKSPFTVCSLFSGSSGNCLYVKAGNTEILIDAGVCARSIEQALKEVGSDLCHIDAILITHEHSDHVKGLSVLCKHRNIPVHITKPSAEQIPMNPPLCDCAVLHEPEYQMQIGEIQITSVPAPHDSVCCVGFRLEYGGCAIAVATDLGRVTKQIVSAFLGVEGIVLESNHDVGMLLENPHYPPFLKERILSGGGHLSNDFSSRFLAYLAEHGTKYALLAHLSKENNTPALAVKTLKEHLKTPMTVSVAGESQISRLFPEFCEKEETICSV